jgi:hypothetical protein
MAVCFWGGPFEHTWFLPDRLVLGSFLRERLIAKGQISSH